jgi:hypothetical protein
MPGALWSAPRLLGECARYLFEVKESRQVRAFIERPCPIPSTDPDGR